MQALTSTTDLVAAVSSELTPTERRIAEAVLAEPTLLAFGTVSDLATRMGTSRPTIVRFANTLGFKGYTQLQRHVRIDPDDVPPPHLPGRGVQGVDRPAVGDERRFAGRCRHVAGRDPLGQEQRNRGLVVRIGSDRRGARNGTWRFSICGRQLCTTQGIKSRKRPRWDE